MTVLVDRDENKSLIENVDFTRPRSDALESLFERWQQGDFVRRMAGSGVQGGGGQLLVGVRFI
jgi:hypothetical protein